MDPEGSGLLRSDAAPVREVGACRSCFSADLQGVLSLGSLHINAFPAPGEPDTAKAPLDLVLCANCHLLQLRHTVEPDLLYKTFHYRSGITMTMKRALLNVVEGIRARVDLEPGDTVVDIGSNDSTLLRYWPENLERIGFEPASNLMGEARSPGLTIVNDYFSQKGFEEVTSKRAAVVTACAMFYDLDDPNEFVHEVASILSVDGVFCIQMAYLPKMLNTNDIGNVCHEHLEYYSLMSLQHLLARHGLYLFDAEVNEINGGSFRVYASKKVRPLGPMLVHLFGSERGLGLDRLAPYKDFCFRVGQIRDQIQGMVEEASQPVYVYGASTKGNTLLQYWDLHHECFRPGGIAGAAERDPLKIGLETVGTRIPIVPEDFARRSARTFLVLPWHFRDEIVARERDWLSRGGKMILPLPTPSVVEGHNTF